MPALHSAAFTAVAQDAANSNRTILQPALATRAAPEEFRGRYREALTCRLIHPPSNFTAIAKHSSPPTRFGGFRC